jgi:hypothetical protein
MASATRERWKAWGRRGLGGSALALGFVIWLAALPTLASADVQTVEFDEGPLGAPLERFGDVEFPHDPGFRPYRTEVGADKAKSGTAVGDIGRCLDELPGAGSDCEFFQAHTTGVLARTAEAVEVFGGKFQPRDIFDPIEVGVLTAFDSAGNKLATSGPVAMTVPDFRTKMTVREPAGKIAKFTVVARTLNNDGSESNIGPDLGIDDVRVTFAASGIADFTISAPSNVVPVVQGTQTQVPIRIRRINGSNGTVDFTVSGLPEGVTGSVAPNPVTNALTDATLTLTADSRAPDTDFNPTEATITAIPGTASVGPAVRTAKLAVRVAKNFQLKFGELSDADFELSDKRIPIVVPDCAPADLPFTVSHDIALPEPVRLSAREDEFNATGLPAGITAEFLPKATVGPDGNLVEQRVARFRAGPDATLRPEKGAPLLLLGAIGDGLGNNTHLLPLQITKPESSANIVSGTSGLTPRFGHEGSRVVLRGTGFCPGTRVEVGNPEASAPTKLIDDHKLEFTVPRFATSGNLLIIPPGKLPQYRTTERFVVDSVRNSDAFQFENYDFGGLSFDNLRDAFGDDEIFLRVNLCGPFFDCSVQTDVPDPFVILNWPVIDELLKDSGGHCFGMSLGIERIKEGKDRRRIGTPFSHVFELPSENGPTAPGLDSYLTAMHARQASNQFLRGAANFLAGISPNSLQDQLDQLRVEFSQDRGAIVLTGGVTGHAAFAYDMVPTPNGADIYVYDSEKPFNPAEDENGPSHKREVEEKVIHVDTVHGHWTQQRLGKPDIEGGNRRTLWVMPHGTVPDNPSMAGLGEASLASYGLTGFFGGVKSESTTKATFVPVESLTEGDTDGPGTWVSRDPRKPLSMQIDGLENKHYTQSYSSPGFFATATDVATHKGVHDFATGHGDSLKITSGTARPLQMNLAKKGGGAGVETTAATVETHASADGTDTVGFGHGSVLTYAHDGAPTSIRFTLTTVHRDGGPATFFSSPVGVGRGDRISAKPMGRESRRVQLTVHHRGGKTTQRVLRNHGKVAGRLKIGRAKVKGHRLTVRLRLAKFHAGAVVGTTLRLMRGNRLVAHKALAVKANNGTKRISWRLPRRLGRGGYRLLVDARAAVLPTLGATTSGTVTAHRSGGIRVR